MTKVLFIGGAGRSGTTLVERVLSRLDGVVAMGEVMHMWRRGVAENQLCGCGQAFHDCPVWTRVGAEAFGGWNRIDLPRMLELKERVDRAIRIPQLLAPTGRLKGDATDYAAHFAAVYRAMASVSGADIVIDSSKQVSLPFALHRDPGIDIAVLQVVRDPRGVAHSWSSAVRRPEITDSDVLMPRYRPADSALSWAVHNVGFDALPIVGVKRLTIRYENFMSDPAGTVGAIAHSIGAHPPRSLMQDLDNHEVDLGVDHTAAGNPMRFRRGRTPLIPDTRWRAEMTAEDASAVRRRTWPLLIRYGYPWEPT